MKPLSATATLAATCSMFLAFGIGVAGLGPALPDLARASGSSPGAIGGVFTALFLGALAAQLGVGRLNDRLGPRAPLLVATLLFGAGILGMTVSRALPWTLACAAIAGLGHGTLVVSAHVLVAGLFPARPAAALNLMNAFFGVGATVGPTIAGFALDQWQTSLPALRLGAGWMLVHVVAIPLFAGPARAMSGQAVSAGPRPWRAPVLWILGAMAFMYVGLENGMNGWTATYLERATGLAAADAARATSGFWLALTCGRLASAALGTRLAPENLLLLGTAGSLAGGALLAMSSAMEPTIAAVLLIGLGFGPVFPTVAAITTARFHGASGAATGVVVAVGSAGGASLPLLQGVLLEQRGPVASALMILAGAAVMLLILLWYWLLHRRGHRASSRSRARPEQRAEP